VIIRKSHGPVSMGDSSTYFQVVDTTFDAPDCRVRHFRLLRRQSPLGTRFSPTTHDEPFTPLPLENGFLHPATTHIAKMVCSSCKTAGHNRPTCPNFTQPLRRKTIRVWVPAPVWDCKCGLIFQHHRLAVFLRHQRSCFSNPSSPAPSARASGHAARPSLQGAHGQNVQEHGVHEGEGQCGC